MPSALIVGHNRYVTVAEADTYLDNSLRAGAWSSFDPDKKIRALLTATNLFERQRWKGDRSNLLVVDTVAVAAGGSGYAVGNILTVVGGTTSDAASVEVLTVSSGAVTSVKLLDAGIYTALPTNPAATTGAGTGCTLNLTSRAQVLDWPRTGVAYVDGTPVSSTTYPQQIKDAQCEMAFELTQSSSLETSAGTGNDKRRVKAGSVEVEWFRPSGGVNGAGSQRFPTIVFELIGQFFEGSGISPPFASGTDAESQFSEGFGLNEGFN